MSTITHQSFSKNFLNTVYDVDSRINELEGQLSTYALQPYSGRLAGLAKAGMGLVEVISAIFATVFAVGASIFSQDKPNAFRAIGACANHVPNGLKNIGVGIAESLPFIGIEVAKLQEKPKKPEFNVKVKEAPREHGVGLMLKNKQLHIDYRVADRVFRNHEALCTSCFDIKIATAAFDRQKVARELESQFTKPTNPSVRVEILDDNEGLAHDAQERFIQTLMQDLEKQHKKLGSTSDVVCLSYDEAFPKQGFIYAITGTMRLQETYLSIRLAFHKDLG